MKSSIECNFGVIDEYDHILREKKKESITQEEPARELQFWSFKQVYGHVQKERKKTKMKRSERENLGDGEVIDGELRERERCMRRRRE